MFNINILRSDKIYANKNLHEFKMQFSAKYLREQIRTWQIESSVQLDCL